MEISIAAYSNGVHSFITDLSFHFTISEVSQCLEMSDGGIWHFRWVSVTIWDFVLLLERWNCLWLLSNHEMVAQDWEESNWCDNCPIKNWLVDFSIFVYSEIGPLEIFSFIGKLFHVFVLKSRWFLERGWEKGMYYWNFFLFLRSLKSSMKTNTQIWNAEKSKHCTYK